MNKETSSQWTSIQHDNLDAFTEMYRENYAMLFRYGLKLSRDINVTKDCIHETFLELWNRRHDLHIQQIPAYLKTCLRNSINKQIRQQQTTTGHSEESERSHFQLSYEQLLIQAQTDEENKDKVKRAISKLSPRQLEIIEMKFFEDKSYDEIAAITKTTPRTVYNQVYTSLNILRKYFKILFF
ncbi:sigma-70 family RNA polymerase sigma factor [Danxiaibacter flavus]|uniref:Sigma-70 family RNA polymerase sigma factor n=1 Tax=Danxiaibacter flavus TaxID=3049108 RepID=A0ABV3Z9B7_9BACT|nr:sigma-70 family RNA polymerase sigma factor [Chitinophagaceae bacterium DXS]